MKNCLKIEKIFFILVLVNLIDIRTGTQEWYPILLLTLLVILFPIVNSYE